MATNPDDLDNHMGRMGLNSSKPKFHELTFEYPVLDLLDAQDLSKMYLLPPNYSSMREEPNIEKFHLKTPGTDINLHLSIRKPDKFMATNRRLPEMFGVLRHLDTSPGKSQLQAATYQSRKGLMWYRLRLTTQFAGAEEKVYKVECSASDWSMVVISHEKEEWCSMIRGLMGRDSDRAYFHVHQRLEQYRWYTKQREKQEVWSWETIPDANQLVALNLDRRGKRHTTTVKDIDRLPDEEEHFLFPCDHQQVVFVPMLKTMSTQMCKVFACKKCDEPVLQEQDFWYLQRHVERQKRTERVEKEDLWKQLDVATEGLNKRIQMYGGTLIFAIEHALESIKVPESVGPVGLSFGDSEEAAKIMESMWDVVGMSEVQIDMSMAELFTSLTEQKDQALEKVGEVLPADWARMSELWMMRAVKLAATNNYDGRSIRSVAGVKSTLHQDAAALSTTVDDLAAIMENANRFD